MNRPQTAFTNGTHEAVADVPIEKGGEGRGFGPTSFSKPPSRRASR